MSEPVKLYRQGTHRVVDPGETLRRLQPLLKPLGITRVANVTGLDHLGIPVVVVCRPNSRSLSVSQGKGLELDAAKASGLMESIESFHAERLTLPLRLASYRELRAEQPVVDPTTLPLLSVSRYSDKRRLLWVAGVDAIADEPVWVPHEMVHLDMTLPLPEGSGCFPLSSNGLASGNTHGEALCHALCELIERDANAVWLWSGGETQTETRLDLASVEDGAAKEVLRRLDDAGMLVGVWDMTTEIGVPVFRATIVDRETDPHRPLYPARGMGCHPSKGVALLRALTEAAQSRLTRISSSRDDVPRQDYELTRHPDHLERIRQALREQPGQRRFRAVPSFVADTFAEDRAWLLQRLKQVGFERVVIVDLSRAGWPVSVVRAIVPGLETKPGAPGYQPGPRARLASARRKPL